MENIEIVRIGDDVVAFYAVIASDGITLIDAGLSGDRKLLERELAARGRSVADIKGVVLTHGDSDHIGIAEELRRDHGVAIYVHEADAARARGEVKSHASAGGFKLGAALGFLWTALRRGGLKNRPIAEVQPIIAPTILDLPGDPEVVGMPGHSPGSVAIRIPSASALFLGDAVTTRHVLTGISRVQPAPFTDEPERAALSLRSLAELPETRILPGHGPEFSGTMRELLAQLDAG